MLILGVSFFDLGHIWMTLHFFVGTLSFDSAMVHDHNFVCQMNKVDCMSNQYSCLSLKDALKDILEDLSPGLGV